MCLFIPGPCFDSRFLQSEFLKKLILRLIFSKNWENKIFIYLCKSHPCTIVVLDYLHGGTLFFVIENCVDRNYNSIVL